VVDHDSLIRNARRQFLQEPSLLSLELRVATFTGTTTDHKRILRSAFAER